jgi:hypothetical protein
MAPAAKVLSSQQHSQLTQLRVAPETKELLRRCWTEHVRRGWTGRTDRFTD